jgi:predicted dehydrogenase/threonine dehydrogenase-like Zn-dependent dehydrogenase
MRQVLRRGLRTIVVDDVPEPMVRPRHVVVQVGASLISSGTETASIHKSNLLKEIADNPSHIQKVWGVLKTMGPQATLAEVRARLSEYAVLGYAGAGVIVAKHADVTDLQIGDRVAYGGEGTGHAESVLVPRNLLARVPDGVVSEHACFATLGCIAMNAVRVAEVGLGEIVAVIGQGLVGQLITQLSRLQGGVVVAVDLRPERVDRARALGADHGVLGGAGLRDAVLSLTAGRGVDCAIVAAASASSIPAAQALAVCRDRGRIVVVGAVELSFPWNEMYLKEIQLFMSRAYGPGSYDPNYEEGGQDYPFSYVRWTENRNMEEFLRLLSVGRVQVDPLITHRFPLEDAAQAYSVLLDPEARSLAVVLRYAAGEVSDAAGRRGAKHKVAVCTDVGSSASRTLRVGLVGAGNLARWVHLPLIKKLDGVSLRAICSTNGARCKSYALRFGAAYCCTDYAEMLGDPEIDVAVITSRNHDHAAQALAALRARKHVFVEKPMALSGDECRELIGAVRHTGKHFTVGFNRRFAPHYVALRQELARRTSPGVITARVNSPAISGSYWMADPSFGGAILGEACHFVDLFYWLLDSEPASVSAYSLPTGSRDPVGLNNMVASFRFADGSIANLTYCTVGSRTSGGERVEVFASGTGAATEDFKSLTIAGSKRTRRSRWFAAKGYREQFLAFVQSIQTGTPPAVTVVDGARATLCCLGMLESARRLQPVDIDLSALMPA